MAKDDKYYVGDILLELSELFSGICEEQSDSLGDPIQTVYTGTRPSATENHSEFLVLSLSRSVYSHGPYQNASVYVDIYVRNGQGGITMIGRLQEILDEVTGKFPYTAQDERWKVSRPKLVLRGDDQLGFAAWRIRSRLFVNTTDRYATERDI